MTFSRGEFSMGGSFITSWEGVRLAGTFPHSVKYQCHRQGKIMLNHVPKFARYEIKTFLVRTDFQSQKPKFKIFTKNDPVVPYKEDIYKVLMSPER